MAPKNQRCLHSAHFRCTLLTRTAGGYCWVLRKERRRRRKEKRGAASTEWAAIYELETFSPPPFPLSLSSFSTAIVLALLASSFFPLASFQPWRRRRRGNSRRWRRRLTGQSAPPTPSPCRGRRREPVTILSSNDYRHHHRRWYSLLPVRLLRT